MESIKNQKLQVKTKDGIPVVSNQDDFEFVMYHGVEEVIIEGYCNIYIIGKKFKDSFKIKTIHLADSSHLTLYDLKQKINLIIKNDIVTSVFINNCPNITLTIDNSTVFLYPSKCHPTINLFNNASVSFSIKKFGARIISHNKQDQTQPQQQNDNDNKMNA